MAVQRGVEATEPQYMAIARVIEDEIQGNSRSDGAQRLPSERFLAERFGCQRPTVRDALELLAGRGLIYRKDRSGWYVSPPRFHYNPAVPLPLTDIAARQDREITTEVISPDPAVQLVSPEPSFGLLAVRRRFLDGIPVLVERIYMAEKYRSRLAKLNLTLPIAHLIQTELGLQITHEKITLNATALAPGLERLLYTRPGAPVLEIERVRSVGDDLLSIDIEQWKSESVDVSIETDWY